MTEKEKELYIKAKRKHYKNCLRIVKRVFSEHLANLHKRTMHEQTIIGDSTTILEMHLKEEIKKQL